MKRMVCYDGDGRTREEKEDCFPKQEKREERGVCRK